MRIAFLIVLLASGCGRAAFDLQANHAFVVDSGWAQYRLVDAGLLLPDGASVLLFPAVGTCNTALDVVRVHEDENVQIDVRTPGQQVPVGVVPIAVDAAAASIADGGPHADLSGRVGPDRLRVQASAGALQITASDQVHLAGRLDARLVLLDGGGPAGTFTTTFDVPFCVAF